MHKLRTSPLCLGILLCLFSVLVLSLGIAEPTGLTGKDEFFLGLRTPMEMIARGEFFVPFLDGVPRIRKPPMLYWLAALSYQTFGISLWSARLVTVLFSSLMVLATVAISHRLLGAYKTTNETTNNAASETTKQTTHSSVAKSAWFAGLILLSFLGAATESRRLMLDIPVAAVSACAFWAFLIWLDRQKIFWILLASALLGLGFLIKGPIALIICGAGIIALLVSHRLHLADILKQWASLLAGIAIFFLIALPWFILVGKFYPEAASATYAEELQAREFFNLSLNIFPGLLQLCLPWSFILILWLWQSRRSAISYAGEARLLIIWLLITFLPFLLIRSFDRYLVGSMIPAAIFLGWKVSYCTKLPPWSARSGLILAIIFGALFNLLIWRFNLGNSFFWLASAGYFIWAWNGDKSLDKREAKSSYSNKIHWNKTHWILAPIFYWVTLLAITFPALQINAVPDAVLELAKTRPIIMFDGPQPALLPILLKKPLRHWERVDINNAKDLMSQKGLIFVEENDLPKLTDELKNNGLRPVLEGNYAVLASHGSGIRFARKGTNVDDWKKAWNTRDLAPLKTTIYWISLAELNLTKTEKP